MKAIGMYIFGGSQTIGHMQVGWEIDQVLEMTEDMLENTFKDIYDICKKYLIVTYNNLENKIKTLDFNKIFRELSETESIKKFKDLNYFRDAWNKILKRGEEINEN